MPTNDRAKIIPNEPAPMGAFAVMRQKRNMAKCRFVCLHDTHESAMNEAKRLTTEAISKQHGDQPEFCFYVVEIVGRCGIINGRLQSSS